MKKCDVWCRKVGGLESKAGSVTQCLFVHAGKCEKKRLWADYADDEPLDDLPPGWLEAAAEGAGAHKAPRTHASPLLSAGSCSQRFRGGDPAVMHVEGG